MHPSLLCVLRTALFFFLTTPLFSQSDQSVNVSSGPVVNEDDDSDSSPSPSPGASSSEEDENLLGSAALPLGAGPQMFFDAEATDFSRDGSKTIFRGDVVAVGVGILLTADRIVIDRVKNEMQADGHVILLTKAQVFLGDKITFGIKTGDILIVNSVLYYNDPARVAELSQRVLGFKPAEIAYEKTRSSRLQNIEERKAKLRENYRRESQSQLEPSANLVDQYSLLLEQEDLTRNQDSPFLARMNEEKRKRFKARRRYWEKGQQDAMAYNKEGKVTSFFRIQGNELIRADGNSYSAKTASWTPCKCEDDEEPAWGFKAQQIDAQVEGYVDFLHPVLEVKGVPILYLPYLKLPLKEKRQSGLLPPTYGQRSRTGTIYSQPVFFAFDDDKDATMTAQIFEQRGTKIGLEGRYQQKKYSGWSLGAESIRDRLWLEDRQARIRAGRYWFESGEIENLCASEDGNIAAEAQCRRSANLRLIVPQNTWRGSQQWRGLSILAPRISFVSEGKLFSDHRYADELSLFDDYQNTLEASTRATLFTPAKYVAHYDGTDAYLGIGGAYGDNVLLNERFEGQQMPFYTTIHSRLFQLDWGLSPIPLYGEVRAEHKRIEDRVSTLNVTPEADVFNSTLGSGHWQRLYARQVAPIISKGVFKLDQYAEWEARAIKHEDLIEKHSSIRSSRFGLTLNLPIDGTTELPGFMQGSAPDAFGTAMMRHYMNWSLGFSVRPEVKRSGPYGVTRAQLFDSATGDYVEGADLVYFPSDRKEYRSEDADIPVEDTMVRHKRLTFATIHTWKTFRQGWGLNQAAANQEPTEEGEDSSYQQRARRELLNSLDRPVRGYNEMFGKGGDPTYVNRYTLQERDAKEVLRFGSDVSYDFVLQEQREEQQRQRARGELEDTGEIGLAQPWSAVNSNISAHVYDAKLSNSLSYNLYYDRTTSQTFGLALPTFLSTDLSFGYSISNDAKYDQESLNLVFTRTVERHGALSTSLLRYFVLDAWYGYRTRDMDPAPPPEYQTVYGLVYNPPSECWRLSFQRQKKYGTDERNAEYLLKLSVLFLGRESPTQNMSPALVRQIRDDEQG